MASLALNYLCCWLLVVVGGWVDYIFYPELVEKATPLDDRNWRIRVNRLITKNISTRMRQTYRFNF